MVEARRIVATLAADSLNGRASGSEEANQSAVFIAGEFEDAGCRVMEGLPGYFMPFGIPSGDEPMVGVNVVAALPGKSRPEEIIIFSAHYDHVGPSTPGSFWKKRVVSTRDEIYNGANDNASGVGAIILLARYFAALQNNERTLVFIAFSGEEVGLLGSQVVSQKMEPDPIKAVLNIEMIGRKSSRTTRPYITGAQYSNLQTLLNEHLASQDEKKYGQMFFMKDPYYGEKLFQRSDNWPFARRGVTAHSIMLTAPYDRYYHSPDDEVRTIDFETMVEVTRAIAMAAEPLVSGTSTPSRINQKKLR